MTTTIPTPGFADPTRDAQAAFRCVLDALARPGQRFTLAALPPAPSPLSAGLGALALTLLDDDCTAWLSPDLTATREVSSWLVFHTGVHLVPDAASAAFVLTSAATVAPVLDDLMQGTDDSPHLSATVVVSVPDGTRLRRVVGRGPGIESTVPVDVPASWTDFDEQWRANAERFPRGVDVVFVGGSDVWALPRTTRLTAEVR